MSFVNICEKIDHVLFCHHTEYSHCNHFSTEHLNFFYGRQELTVNTWLLKTWWCCWLGYIVLREYSRPLIRGLKLDIHKFTSTYAQLIVLPTSRPITQMSYLLKVVPLSSRLTPETMWSWMRPARGVPSLGTRYWWSVATETHHNSDVIISAMAFQITSPMTVYSTVYSGTDQRKHQSSASLAFVRGIHRWPMNSPHKGPVTRKMFPFDDVIMWRSHLYTVLLCHV